MLNRSNIGKKTDMSIVVDDGTRWNMKKRDDGEKGNGKNVAKHRGKSIIVNYEHNYR